MEEKSGGRNCGEALMEEKMWRRNHRGEIIGESIGGRIRRRNPEGEIIK